MILFKLLNRGFISEINGCISTGKEANVYHCTTKEGKDRAVKIYKTSILVSIQNTLGLFFLLHTNRSKLHTTALLCFS
jgi:serine/threonine-protein kinase RIO1